MGKAGRGRSGWGWASRPVALRLAALAVPAVLGTGCEQVLGLEWTPSAPDEGSGGGGSSASGTVSDPPGAGGTGQAGGGGPGGSGGSAAPAGCVTALDCPVPIEACRVALCEQGACGWVGMSPGLACGAGVCDGAGSCVACNVDQDCGGGDLCEAHVCVNDCHDGAQNGTETDVDCGGGGCPKCPDGMACEHDSDCKKKHCRDGVCEEHEG